MKNKIIFLIAVVFLSVLFILEHNQKKPKIRSATNSELVPVKKSLLELQKEKGFDQLNEKEKVKKVYEALEKMPPKYDRLKRQYQIALSSLPDITFYGRIVDQYGKPVSNAEIIYEGTNVFLAAGGGFGHVFSDDDGYFEIDTSGASLVLGGIGHREIDGVYYKRGKLRSVGARFVSYDDPQGGALNWRNYATKENAYLIHAWRLGKYEGAISGIIEGWYERTGKVYTLTLNGKPYDYETYKVIKKAGMHTGHLYISCKRSQMKSNRDYGDWEVHITPVNGGIQETDDLYMNIAPESGYQPSLDIVMHKGSQNYKHALWNQRYYFMSNGGKEYGSLDIDIDPFGKVEDDLSCIIDIKYKINPTGSRNLELKRDNTSQPNSPQTQKLASNS